ncbi:DUF2207 domain-containing protein [Olsenella massiliensis]|uniref:DUF2207 domain-containing protein n=1 Tax=Olsenella massiliensis TaxID=1622075 RepID=UPI00071CBEC5|nr:DUF2207 domain-containing protein [Olsenella massiliensis]
MTPRPRMSRRYVRIVMACALLALCVLAAPLRVLAKDYSIDEVRISATVAADGSVSVSETREFAFDGSFNGVYWSIPTGSYDGRDVHTSIGAVGIMEGTTFVPFEQSDSGEPNTYSVTDEGDTIRVKLYSPHTDERVTFAINYTDSNLAARYQDTAELYWKFVSDGWDVESSNVSCTVSLPVPAGTTVTPGDNVRAWGHGPLDATVGFTGNDVTYAVPGVGGSEYAEARITFPAEWLASAPLIEQDKLQSILTQEQAWADDANARRHQARVISWGAIGLDLVAAVGSIVAGLAAWGSYQRSHKAQFDDTYFRDVPSDDHPAVLGALLNGGKPRGEDLTAALMRLTDIGAVKLDLIRTRKTGFLGRERTEEDCRLTRTDKDLSSQPNHKLKIDYATLRFLFEKVARWADSEDALYFKDVERVAKDEAEKYSGAYETWEDVVGGACASRGFFTSKAKTGKGRLYALCVLDVLLAVVTVFLVIAGVVAPAPGGGIAAALLLTGVVLGVLGGKMRTLSPEAIEITAKLEALRRWLKDFTRLKEAVPTDVVLWNHLLVMAVVLGVADEVIDQLRATMPQILEDPVVAPVYGWYYGGGPGGMPQQAFSSAVGQAHHVSTAALAASSMSSGGGGGGGFSGGGGGGFGGGGGGGAF